MRSCFAAIVAVALLSHGCAPGPSRTAVTLDRPSVANAAPRPRVSWTARCMNLEMGVGPHCSINGPFVREIYPHPAGVSHGVLVFGGELSLPDTIIAEVGGRSIPLFCGPPRRGIPGFPCMLRYEDTPLILRHMTDGNNLIFQAGSRRFTLSVDGFDQAVERAGAVDPQWRTGPAFNSWVTAARVHGVISEEEERALLRAAAQDRAGAPSGSRSARERRT